MQRQQPQRLQGEQDRAARKKGALLDQQPDADKCAREINHDLRC